MSRKVTGATATPRQASAARQALFSGGRAGYQRDSGSTTFGVTTQELRYRDPVAPGRHGEVPCYRRSVLRALVLPNKSSRLKARRLVERPPRAMRHEAVRSHSPRLALAGVRS